MKKAKKRKPKNTCAHYENVWVSRTWVSDWDATEEVQHGGDWQSVCRQVDIDLHRYKCTMCGEIGYYSQRAKNAYKKGKDDPSINLKIKR